MYFWGDAARGRGLVFYIRLHCNVVFAFLDFVARFGRRVREKARIFCIRLCKCGENERM
jgi:hypothetical protein